MENNLLTIDEMASLLKVKKTWLYQYTRRRGPDGIPVVRVGKYCRFVPQDVLNWLRDRQSEDAVDRTAA